MSSPETLPQQPDYSYEAFAQRDFYIALNERLLKYSPEIHSLVDFATGTGAVIDHLRSHGKLKEPFTAIGVDIDEEGLERARRKFTNLNTLESGSNYVNFINYSVAETPITSSSQELVTYLHAIHLMPDPLATLVEAERILEPRGTILVITGYTKDFAYPPRTEARRQWGLLAKIARDSLKSRAEEIEYVLKQKGEDEKANDLFARGRDPFQNTASDYLDLLAQAGFQYSVPDNHITNMDRDDMRAICSYREFAQGRFPNIPLEYSIPALVEAVDPAFERMETDYFQRGWYLYRAKKKAA